MLHSDPSLTERLRQYSQGDQEIADAVLRQVLPKLRQIAVGQLARERVIAPLSPTELIHEVWLRRIRKGGWQISDREHFYSIAAHAMRCVLVDFARTRLADMRGGGEIPLPLDDSLVQTRWAGIDAQQLIEIGLMMNRLDQTDPSTARVAELHYFAGFTLEESAEIMNLTLRQVRHRWVKAKRWLRESLTARPLRTPPDHGRSAQ
ncbi:MAG TPA: ECF-type sigma factor [Bryobacteraceae bacterium]|jgi:RNA polymerase sigma factor (TIGR02999 family)